MLKNKREFGSWPLHPSLSTGLGGLLCTDESIQITLVSLGNRRDSEAGHGAAGSSSEHHDYALENPTRGKLDGSGVLVYQV